MTTKSEQQKLIPNVIWEGSFLTNSAHSYTSINFINSIIYKFPNWKLSLAPMDNPTNDTKLADNTIKELLWTDPTECNVTVRMLDRHDWSVSLTGNLAVYAYYRYLSLPEEWMKALNNNVDELWCSSKWVRDGYQKLGIKASKIKVVPHSVDTVPFIKASKAKTKSNKKFTFLFMGSKDAKAGVNVINSYINTFNKDDSVKLVIGTNFQYDSNSDDTIVLAKKLIIQNKTAEIEILENTPASSLPSIFANCDCFIQPFGLDGIYESFAVKKPVIALTEAECADYITDELVFPLRSQFISINVKSEPEILKPEIIEIDTQSLRSQLKSVFTNPDLVQSTTKKAFNHLTKKLTNEKTADVVEKLLTSLLNKKKTNQVTFDLVNEHYSDRELNFIAEGYLRKAVNDNPVPETYLVLGKYYMRNGPLQTADSVQTHALKLFPNHPEINYQIGFLRLFSNKEASSYQPLLNAWKSEDNIERNASTLKHLRNYYVCQIDFQTRRKGVSPNNKKIKDFQQKIQFLEKELESKGFATSDGEPVGARLSLSMIVKNESKFLPQCLDSVKGLVDEIVICDTGSTDDTVEIAKRYGAKVVHFDWTKDFSEARNFALKHTTGDWVLILDADEAIEPDGIACYEEAIQHPQIGCYLISIANFTNELNRNELLFHSAVRLFRNVKQAQWQGRIHEQIVISMMQAGYQLGRLEGTAIMHYGYDPTVMVDKAKEERTETLLIKALEEDPDNWFQVFNLGNSYFCSANYEKALEYLPKAARNLERGQPVADQAYHLWAASLVLTDRHREALPVCDEAIRRGLDCHGTRYMKALCCLNAERYEDTLSELQILKNMPWKGHNSGDYTVTTFKADALAGEALLCLKRYDEAEVYLRRGYAMATNYGPLGCMLGKLLVETGRLNEAEPYLMALKNNPMLGAESLRILTNAYIEQDLHYQAAETCGEICKIVPEDSDLWRKWISLATKSDNWEQFIAAYQWKSERMELNANEYINWGRALGNLDQWHEALKYFSKAIDLAPYDSNAFFNTGDALYKIGAYNEAVNAYQLALDRNPDSVDGWFCLGNALFQIEVYEAAEVAYRHVIAKSPQHTGALLNLAQMESERAQKVS